LRRKLRIDFPSKDLAVLEADHGEILNMKAVFAPFSRLVKGENWFEPFDIFRLENEDRFPSYNSERLKRDLRESVDLVKGTGLPANDSLSSKRRSRVYKPREWVFPLDPIDRIEDMVMVSELEERYSLENLQNLL
jgi:hypothetical protein